MSEIAVGTIEQFKCAMADLDQNMSAAAAEIGGAK